MVVIVLGALIKEWELITTNLAQVGWVVLIFNLVSLAVGYFAPILMKIRREQAIAIAFEIGIHNGTLALFVAISVLNSTEIAVPAAVYSILMFFTAGAFGFFVKSRNF